MKLETIKIGRIVNAHGIHGEVRVQPRDGDPAFLTQFKTFLLDGVPVQPHRQSRSQGPGADEVSRRG